MRVAFLYNDADQDPALQCDDNPEDSPIATALERSGHDVVRIACTLDLAGLRRALDRMRPDVAFNRVDSLGGSDAMQAAVPMLLDAIGVPYTGCPTAALTATASKVVAKERMAEAGLPTPAWISSGADRSVLRGLQTMRRSPKSGIGHRQFIIKADREHASFQLDDTSIVGTSDRARLLTEIDRRQAQTGRPFFAEEFIDGRELNIALWGHGPEALPPAEIDFSMLPPGKPRIVGAPAKWDTGSVEYEATDRQFDFPPGDQPLMCRLEELALECWRLFKLRGYARVDFRVDVANQPWILEVNCNPCLSPDSGFAAALQQAGIAYDDAMERILKFAVDSAKQPSHSLTTAASN